jgi:hypothetical protein
MSGETDENDYARCEGTVTVGLAGAEHEVGAHYAGESIRQRTVAADADCCTHVRAFRDFAGAYIPPSNAGVGTGLSPPLEHRFEVAIAEGPRQEPFEQLLSMQSESSVQVAPVGTLLVHFIPAGSQRSEGSQLDDK